jgi:hypothetical protein
VKPFFYNTAVAQAQRIDFGSDRVVFAFSSAHRTLREQVEQNKTWLESVAASIAGRPTPVTTVQQDSAEPSATMGAQAPPAADSPAPVDLKAAAMRDTTVQAMLDVFPAEIEDVEEI